MDHMDPTFAFNIHIHNMYYLLWYSGEYSIIENITIPHTLYDPTPPKGLASPPEYNNDNCISFL